MSVARWMVEVDLTGRESEARSCDGDAHMGARTIVTAFGTAWRGVGATPQAALESARRARSEVLPHVDEVARRLELALGLVTQGAEDPIPSQLVSDVEGLLGRHHVPQVVSEWTLRAWLVELRRALGAP